MKVDKLLEDIDVGYEVLDSIVFFWEKEQMEAVDSLLRDLQILVRALIKRLKPLSISSSLIQTGLLYGMNADYSIDRFFLFPSMRNSIFRHEIYTCYWSLRYCVNCQYNFFKDYGSIKEFRKKLISDLNDAYVHRMEKKEHRYKISIYVVAYNKLEYTKCAIESIMKYTDLSRADVRLVVFNNGSTDGTETYFASLPPYVTSINFKHNIMGGVACPFSVEEQYYVGFSNDAVATPNWLDQMLACMESSDDIAVVVPTCNEESIAAHQGIPVPYQNQFSDMGKMQDFAKKYNHINPSLWEERQVLMPFVSMWRTDVSSISLTDPMYTKAQFVDDDFSTTLRRTGWRMILAKDTFLHHFGGVTYKDSSNSGSDSSFSDDINAMRKVYFDKWGVDAWDSRGDVGTDYPLELLKPVPHSRILWIDPKFGGHFLQVKNVYRSQNCGDVQSDAIVTDERYLPDARFMFHRCIQSDDLLQSLDELQEKYDVIGMGVYLHEIARPSAIKVLEVLYSLLKPGGRLIVPVKNWASAVSLKEIIETGGPFEWGHPEKVFTGLSLRGILGVLKRHPFLNRFHQIGVLAGYEEEFCEKMYSRLHDIFSQSHTPEIFKEEMNVSMVWLGFGVGQNEGGHE